MAGEQPPQSFGVDSSPVQCGVREYEGALEDAARFFNRKQEALDEAAARFGIEYTREVIHGHPARALLEHARREEFDLLVVGRKGYNALERSCWAASR